MSISYIKLYHCILHEVAKGLWPLAAFLCLLESEMCNLALNFWSMLNKNTMQSILSMLY